MQRSILGNSGIEVSKLCFGTGSSGWNGSSIQSRLGDGLVDLLHYAYDRGVTFWDAADMYGTHAHIGKALKRLRREDVVITTKTVAEDAKKAEEDIPRFLREIGADYLDIVLLHCLTDPDWPERMEGVMEVLTRFQQEGKIRALGVSCHNFEAFKRAAQIPWVEVVLARINYDGARMCAPPNQVIPVIERMHANGKGVYGMKVVGDGRLAAHVRRAFRFVLELDSIDAITVGMKSQEEIDENIGLVEEFSSIPR